MLAFFGQIKRINSTIPDKSLSVRVTVNFHKIHVDFNLYIPDIYKYVQYLY